MIIKENEKFKLRIYNVNGEPFHWKPVYDSINHNYHRLQNGKDFKFVNTWSYYMPITNRFFWLWWCLDFTIKPKLISGKTPNRYVEFRKTHLELMDLPHGSWKD